MLKIKAGVSVYAEVAASRYGIGRSLSRPCHIFKRFKLSVLTGEGADSVEDAPTASKDPARPDG
jgi:hypothetical protein